jgi:hypothetical protein
MKVEHNTLFRVASIKPRRSPANPIKSKAGDAAGALVFLQSEDLLERLSTGIIRHLKPALKNERSH